MTIIREKATLLLKSKKWQSRQTTVLYHRTSRLAEALNGSFLFFKE